MFGNSKPGVFKCRLLSDWKLTDPDELNYRVVFRFCFPLCSQFLFLILATPSYHRLGVFTTLISKWFGLYNRHEIKS